MASAPWACGREDRANAEAARGLPSHERTVPATLTIPTTAIPTIVTLNSDADIPASDLTGVLMHELGHVVGLDHSTMTDQVMFPGTGGGRTTWGQGDLAGLQRVGRPAGCLPEVRPAAS